MPVKKIITREPMWETRCTRCSSNAYPTDGEFVRIQENTCFQLKQAVMDKLAVRKKKRADFLNGISFHV